MAVIRTRKESLPSDVVPSGDAGASTPVAPSDRTRSALQSQNTAARAANRPVLDRSAPRAPAARGGGTSTQSAAPSSPRTLINDTNAELKRVVWPTNEEVRAGTIVTVMLLLFFSMYIFVLDYAADWLFHAMGLYSRTTGKG